MPEAFAIVLEAIPDTVGRGRNFTLKIRPRDRRRIALRWPGAG